MVPRPALTEAPGPIFARIIDATENQSSFRYLRRSHRCRRWIVALGRKNSVEVLCEGLGLTTHFDSQKKTGSRQMLLPVVLSGARRAYFTNFELDSAFSHILAKYSALSIMWLPT